ncbi:signal peptidase I [Enterococcus termitis]|uniref:Signal peptidase I n=1 Tax=Enterococcus termitis TaxID=332950 RepID=A0A1E5GW62_9ENTE|nr:signal peptidase I [Enterococcus termitis]
MNKKKSVKSKTIEGISSKKERRIRKGKTSALSFSQKKKRKQAKRKRLIFEWSITLGISLILLIIINISTFSVVTVDGYSMTPTINDQDKLFVFKWGKVNRFQLIYFKDPKKNEVSVRRIIGLPGERIEYREGILYVDNSQVPERFIEAIDEATEEPITGNFTLDEILEVGSIPEGHYFVLGDNRQYATDSRYYGFIDEKSIIGVAKARIFPFHNMRQF